MLTRGRLDGVDRPAQAEPKAMTVLEQTMPVYHFHNRHRRFIAAPPEAVWAALTSVTLDELTVTRPMVAVRHLASSPIASSKPLFSDGPVTIVQSWPPTYAIGASISRPWQRHPESRPIDSLDSFNTFTTPGWVKYLVDFSLAPAVGGTMLSTETRGYATDDRARRRFAVYWTLIRGGSGLVRRDLLATVARLATSRDNPA